MLATDVGRSVGAVMEHHEPGLNLEVREREALAEIGN